MTDEYCSLGKERGCVIREGIGTCDAVKRGTTKDGTRRVCRGVAAVVCAEAFERWEANGRPAAAPDRPPEPRPAPPKMDAQDRWLDPAVSTVAGDFAAWEIYGKTEEERERQRRTRDYVEGLIEKQRSAWDPPNLVLQGVPGTGKTLLARIAARVASDAGAGVRFVVFRELLLGVKATRNAGTQQAEEAILRPYKEADLLILDDIRPVFDSQDDENIADELFKARYGQDRGEKRRPTIVTTNLSRSELRDVIGESAMRRLLCDGEVERQVFDWVPWQNEAAEASPSGHWSEDTFCLLDLETTNPDPKTARMVQASFVVQNPDGLEGKGSYATLVNPGVPIDDDAIAVHGITQERAEKDGVAPAVALEEITRRLQRAAERGYPVVIFNLPFDWPIYEAECGRVDLGGPVTRPLFVDPLLIDRKVDKYRKGSRTLGSMVKHYLGREFEAHDARTDALETGRLLREMVRRHKVLQRPDLTELQDIQRRWWVSWRDQFNEYQRGPKGKGYVNEEEWPV